MDNKFKYQPERATSVICWSFTGMIFLVGALLWLEITVLQPWTISAFILFLLVVWIQVKFRYLQIDAEKLRINKVIATNNVLIKYHDITALAVNKHSLVVRTADEEYELLMSSNHAKQAAQAIRKYK
ncbi:putative membrane spanning protein [Ligilactobacillus salitolerans]|uniref:Putative membrane spanning protein n=1 Tax=Ligilactobacillus salitolerans TaxID=1808352 RepID=A0A401IW83_9LACO|nr:EbsA family protein [Ligilactobacillus salitolerans]GBG95810.1 putative membrane spanning protein [Ligilactobacillus salitolerans]